MNDYDLVVLSVVVVLIWQFVLDHAARYDAAHEAAWREAEAGE